MPARGRETPVRSQPYGLPVQLSEIVGRVTGSRPEDWHRVDAGNVTYLDRLEHGWTYENGVKQSFIEVESHHSRVVMKDDVQIGMAWGVRRDPDGERFHEDWTERFADEQASAAWLDLLYNGQLVDRRMYVVVDGGRCKLPLPEQIFAEGFGVGPREKRLWVRREDALIMGLINALDSGYDYARYLSQAGFDVPNA